MKSTNTIAAYTLLLVVLLLQQQLFAGNNQPQIDSLHTLLNNSKNEQRVDLLLQLSSLYNVEDIETSAHMAQVAADLSNELNYEKGGALAYLYLGDMYYHAFSIDSSIIAYKKSLAYYEKLDSSEAVFMVLNKLGVSYKDIGDYSVALDYLVKALLIMEEKRLKSGIGACYLNIGVVMQNLNEYEQAQEYFEKALTYLNDESNLSLKGEVLLNIGLLYFNQKKHEEAERYYQDALISIKMSGDKKNEVNLYYNMATLYFDKSDVNNAISFYQSALSLNERGKHDAKLEADIKIKLGSCYASNLKQLPKGLLLINEGMAVAKQLNYKSAEENAYRSLSKAYYDNKLYKEAFDAGENYLILHDSIQQMSLQKEIIKSEILIETEKRNRQEQEQVINKLKDKLESTEKNTYVILFGTLSVILFLLFSMVKKKKQQSR